MSVMLLEITQPQKTEMLLHDLLFDFGDAVQKNVISAAVCFVDGIIEAIPTWFTLDSEYVMHESSNASRREHHFKNDHVFGVLVRPKGCSASRIDNVFPQSKVRIFRIRFQMSIHIKLECLRCRRLNPA